MDRPRLAVQWHAGQTARSHHASRCALSPSHWGALAATAGTLVAVGLLVLTMLVVGARPAEAVEGGGAFNVTNNTTYDFSPDYSPSGEKIAYRVGASRSAGLSNDIYTILVDGTGRRNLTNDATEERDPSFSPDGQKIAYAGFDGQDWEIYVMNADGGGERTRLTNNTTDESEIDWSPDGTKIAYERGRKGQDREIYTIGLGSARRVVQVTNNATHDIDPSFSPSGQRIAYAHDDGQDWEIYTINADGGGKSARFTNNTTDDTELCWSPDGTKIAFKGTEMAYVDSGYVERDSEIYTVSLGPGRGVGQVTHNGVKDGEPSYSPDGAKMAYEGYDGQQDKEIYTITSPTPPPNDDFASAPVLIGLSAVSNGTNAGATLQRGDPPLVDTGNTRHTVWYRWTAPFSGAVEMNTCTSDFDTLLGVYTGGSRALTEVAANDDGCARGSKVTFNATENATYRMLVDGYNGGQGAFTLQVIDKRP